MNSVAVLSSASAGGAGIAAYRCYQALSKRSDITVDFVDIALLGVVDPAISPTITASNHKITNTHFTIDHANASRQWVVDFLSSYDVINIQWASYLLSLSEILMLAKQKKKILFTLHDFNYMTGGCHYPAGCLGYQEACISCPQVDESLLSQQGVIENHQLKREIFSLANVHLAAPSAFIVNSAVNAGVVPVERAHVLRNAYEPIGQQLKGEPVDPYSILLIADSFDERRKGLSLAVASIREAAEQLEAENIKLKLHVVGGLDEQVLNLLHDSYVEVIMHGHIQEHAELVETFEQCRFILSCSYEDNWPNILVEAACYGCVPIVGRWHGCEEFVDTFSVGYLADQYQPSSFAVAIKDAIFDTSVDMNSYASTVRKTHSVNAVSKAYKRAFESIGAIDLGAGSQKETAAENTLSINHLAAKYNSLSLSNGKKYLVSSHPSPFRQQDQFESFELNDNTDMLIRLVDVYKKSSPSSDLNYGIKQCRIEEI